MFLSVKTILLLYAESMLSMCVRRSMKPIIEETELLIRTQRAYNGHIVATDRETSYSSPRSFRFRRRLAKVLPRRLPTTLSFHASYSALLWVANFENIKVQIQALLQINLNFLPSVAKSYRIMNWEDIGCFLCEQFFQWENILWAIVFGACNWCR